MTSPMLPGVFGQNLGNYVGIDAPDSAETIATLIDAAIPNGALGCLIQAIGADVLWRDDGTAPTSSDGFTLFAGQPPVFFSGAQMRALQLIQGSGGAATLNFGFYR